MKYAIYPFKRYKKYRLYVVFDDEHGDEVRRSTGVTYPLDATESQKEQAREEAEQSAHQIVMEYFKGSPEKEKDNDDDIQLLADYLEELYYPRVRTNCEESTLVSYRNALNHFIRICGNRLLDQYKRFDFEKYKIQRFDKEGDAKSTINIELRSIKAAFNWAYKNRIIDRNPFRGEDYMFDTKPNRRSFTKDELQALFDQTDGKMIGLVIRLTYTTGMRIGEVSALQWEMVDLEERGLHLPGEITKSGDPRGIPINDKAFNVLKVYENLLKKQKREYPDHYENRPDGECYVTQKQRGVGRYKLRSIQDMFRKEMNKAGLPKELTFHCLRHSFATHLRAKGGDLGAVSKMMGHTTTKVTAEFYDHTTALNFQETANLL